MDGSAGGGAESVKFEVRLRAELEQIARELRAEHASIQGTLEVITRAAVEVVPGAEHAGITLVRKGAAVRVAGGDLAAAENDRRPAAPA